MKYRWQYNREIIVKICQKLYLQFIFQLFQLHRTITANKQIIMWTILCIICADAFVCNNLSLITKNIFIVLQSSAQHTKTALNAKIKIHVPIICLNCIQAQMFGCTDLLCCSVMCVHGKTFQDVIDCNICQIILSGCQIL